MNKNKLFIKQYGLVRSGTNYLRSLIEINFTDVRVLVHQLRGKHQDVCRFGIKVIENIHKRDAEFIKKEMLASDEERRITQDDLDHLTNPGYYPFRYLLIIKNPYSWIQSYISYYRKNRSLCVSSDDFPVKIGLFFVSNKNLEELARYWVKSARAYVDFINNNPSDSILVKYEDLITDYSDVLSAIKKKFDLTQKFDIYIDEQKEVYAGYEKDIKDFNKSRYTQSQYLGELGLRKIRLINTYLDEKLMEYLGYEISNNKKQSIKPLVGAYYYPWYHKGRWINEKITNSPVLGRYESADESIVTKHIEFAKRANIDYFLISYTGINGKDSETLNKVLIPCLEKANFRFVIFYETPLALKLPAGKLIDLNSFLKDGVKAGDRFVEHFEHIIKKYLTNPHYLYFNNKAVIVIYLVRDIVNGDLYMDKIKEIASKQGVELHLIADTIFWSLPKDLNWTFLKKNFKAITSYNMYGHKLIQRMKDDFGEEYPSHFLESMNKQFAGMYQEAQKYSLDLVPNVMPGYSDLNLRGHDRVPLHRDNMSFYKKNWKISSQFISSKQPFIFITSFNEWHEGTEIEPSLEYGDSYLQLTKELLSK